MELMTKAGEATTTAVKAMSPGWFSADSFFGRNKTKLLGLVLITVNYLQLPANADALKSVMSPTAWLFVNMGLGLAVLWVGFLNNPEKE